METVSNRIGISSLFIGTLIFAASFAVLGKIVDLGNQQLVEGRNPVSYCNVLLVGNVIAGFTYLALFHRQLQPDRLRGVSTKNWVMVVLVGILEGAIAPTLIFLALTQTSVASVVLLQSTKIPLVLLSGYLFFREAIGRSALYGSLLAMAGTFVMFSHGGFTDANSGSLKVLIAALLMVISVQLRRAIIDHVSVGIFSTIRVVVGTVFFLIALLMMRGVEHFTDLFNPFLWKWMLFYALGIVVLGQLTWQWGLQQANSIHLSLAEAAIPLLGLLFGFLILSEIPMKHEWIGGAVILCGLGLTMIGLRNREQNRTITEKGQNFSGV